MNALNFVFIFIAHLLVVTHGSTEGNPLSGGILQKINVTDNVSSIQIIQSVTEHLGFSINISTFVPTVSPTIEPSESTMLTATEYIAIGILCFILLCACGYISVFIWGFIDCCDCDN